MEGRGDTAIGRRRYAVNGRSVAAEPPFHRLGVCQRLFIGRVYVENVVRKVAHRLPVAVDLSRVDLVQEAVNPSLCSLAGHGSRMIQGRVPPVLNEASCRQLN